MRWMLLLTALVWALGCGGADSAGEGDGGDGADARSGVEGDDDSASGSVADADADDTDAGGPADAAAVLVGTWDATEDQNGMLRPGMLVFTYRADGKGHVVEEGGEPKDYDWAYDADAGTLHVETSNEDLLFTAVFEGDTLTLTNEEHGMRLVMRKLDDAGAGGAGDE